MATKKHQLSTAEVIKNGAEIFHKIRWGFGIVVCPYCGSLNICEHGDFTYKCNSCKHRFSDKTNTLMHGSKLPVSTWMQAVYELINTNHIPSTELAIKLGVNQKTAWFLIKRLQCAMQQDKVLLHQGIVAQDEMYIGGCLSNYHYGRKLALLRKEHYIQADEKDYSKQAIFQLNADLKQPVFGMTDGEQVVMYAMPNKLRKEYLYYLNKKHVAKGSITVSDESALYNDWKKHTGNAIYTNNHHNNQYRTENGLTSNAIGNRFSWYKRGFNGRITHCKYHQLYLNEFCFRYNTRQMSTMERFNLLITSTIGKHYTMADIKATLDYKEFEGLCKRKTEPKHFTIEEIRHMLSLGLYERVEQDGRVYTQKDYLKGLI